jgi:hypothetical protein
MMGALHGTSWLPQQWLDNLENASKPPRNNLGEHKSFFNKAAADVLLAGGTAAAADAPAGADGSNAAANVAAGGGHEDVVLTTRGMGRDAAMQLAHLLAQLDCRTL